MHNILIYKKNKDESREFFEIIWLTLQFSSTVDFFEPWFWKFYKPMNY